MKCDHHCDIVADIVLELESACSSFNATLIYNGNVSTSVHVTASLTLSQSPRPSLLLPNSAAARIYKDTDWRITLFPLRNCELRCC